METLKGKFALLPGGDKVRIERVYKDGYAKAIRVSGQCKGRKVVCLVSRLEILDN